MLTAAFIFVFSFAALIQFVGLQWRAGLIRVANTSFASETEATYNMLKGKDFADLAAFKKLCPDMESAPNLRTVRLYHGLLQVSSAMGAKDWAKSEMQLCSRYAAAVLMQHVQQNQAVAVEVGSF
jgi:hypothetical protein